MQGPWITSIKNSKKMFPTSITSIIQFPLTNLTKFPNISATFNMILISKLLFFNDYSLKKCMNFSLCPSQNSWSSHKIKSVMRRFFLKLFTCWISQDDFNSFLPILFSFKITTFSVNCWKFNYKREFNFKMTLFYWSETKNL